MRNQLFLLLSTLSLLLATTGCERYENVLLSEIDPVQEPVVVEFEEEEPFLLRHSLGDVIMTEDTIGRAFYSDEFGWFEFSNNGNPYMECEVSATNFGFSSSNTPIPGGNPENVRFSITGFAPNINGSIGANMTYEIGEPTDPEFDFYIIAGCIGAPELVIDELTDTYISGRVTGTLQSILTNTDCEDPNSIFRDVDIEFILPRRECE